jgi:predicted MFS family arabinose efflux permease
LATLIAARWLGMWTDQWGKRQMFRLMMTISIVPMMMTTLLEPVPLYIALLVSTFYFLTMNGRMIPGMALLTSAAQPQQRGAFMSINGAVQSVALGCATFVGGLLIQTDAQGHVSHFWIAGLVGLLSSVVAYWAAGEVRIYSENKPS